MSLSPRPLPGLIALSAALCLPGCAGDSVPEGTPTAEATQLEPETETEPTPTPQALTCAQGQSSTPGLVTSGRGDIQGTQEDNGVWRFLGIPFTEAPVGDRRWRPPLAP